MVTIAENKKQNRSINLVSVPRGNIEDWGECNMADASPRTDISTDDTDDKNQRVKLLCPSHSLFLEFYLEKFVIY